MSHGRRRGGQPQRGIEFLKSAERQDARRQMVRAIDSLIAADEADVLSRAKSLIVAVKAPLAEVKSTQEKVARAKRRLPVAWSIEAA